MSMKNKNTNRNTIPNTHSPNHKINKSLKKIDNNYRNGKYAWRLTQKYPNMFLHSVQMRFCCSFIHFVRRYKKTALGNCMSISLLFINSNLWFWLDNARQTAHVHTHAGIQLNSLFCPFISFDHAFLVLLLTHINIKHANTQQYGATCQWSFWVCLNDDSENLHICCFCMCVKRLACTHKKILTFFRQTYAVELNSLMTAHHCSKSYELKFSNQETD